MARWLVLAAVWVALAGSNSSARAAENATGEFVAQYCVGCHNKTTQKGGVRLDHLNSLDDPTTLDLWVRVHDQVSGGAMPPKKADQPEPRDRKAFTTALSTGLIAADREQVKKAGRGRLRRMNRAEYENALRDLLDMPTLDLRSSLPEDGRQLGFDKVASGLDISHVQMTKYLQAADASLRKVLARPAVPPESKVWRQLAAEQDSVRGAIAVHAAAPLKGHKLADGLTTHIVGDPVKDHGNSYRAANFSGKADSVAVFTGVIGAHQPEGVQPDRFRPPVAGWYSVGFSVWGLRWQRTEAGPAIRSVSRSFQTLGLPYFQDEKKHWQSTPLAKETPVYDWKENVEFYGDAPHTHVVRASVRGNPVGYFDAHSLKPTEHTFKVWLDPSDRISFHAMTLPASGPANHGDKNGVRDYEGPGIAYDWFRIEGPLSAEVGDKKPRLFGPKSGPADDVRGRLRAFATRAFRRPVSAADMEPIEKIVDGRLAAKASEDDALLAGYTAVLCSPDFLFIGLEPGQYAVASRLAYFLWNSPPDDALIARAAAGELAKPGVLSGEVDRLLADPRSDRFVEHFLDEWLELSRIDFTTPDPQLYPEFDPWLRDSMIAETRAYFRKLIADDRDVAHLIASDFLLVNQRLAELYGIRGVTGASIRSVPVPAGSGRGGFLTQASVLKVTANGTGTSPVLRGAWIAERLLGSPRTPPPPNIPAVDPDATGAVTIREILKMHSADRTCAACHAKFDPPGFALEQFDAIGGKRDRYRVAGVPKADGPSVEVVSGSAPTHRARVKLKLGLPVDPTGELADGRKFQDADGLRKLLLADPDRLTANVVRQFTVYATGAGIRFSDRAEIDAIVARSGKDHRGMKALIHAVVASEVFRGVAPATNP